MLSHLHWQRERGLGQLPPCGSTACPLPSGSQCGSAISSARPWWCLSSFRLQIECWETDMYQNGQTLASRDMYPGIRGHWRTSRKLVTRTRGSGSSASKHKLPFPPCMTFYCARPAIPLQEGNPGSMILFAGWREQHAGFSLSYIPESQPFVSCFSCTTVHLYSTGFPHIKFIAVWVEVAPKSFRAVRRVIFIIGTQCAISVTHCTRETSVGLWRGNIQLNCLNALIAISVNVALHHLSSNACITKPGTTLPAIKLVWISVTYILNCAQCPLFQSHKCKLVN